MRLSEFDYNLPKELIANEPKEARDSSRLFVVDKKHKSFAHHHFYDLLNFLDEGDLLILNSSKVFPARLYGRKETGGRVEVLLDHELEPGVWKVIGKSLKEKSRITFKNSRLEAIVERKEAEVAILRFNMSGETFFGELDKIGEVPLPPYIQNNQEESIRRKEYQTVYAKERGSAAAPTAGLHFTPELLEEIRKKGVLVLELTLHVGLGTFLPVKTEDILDHKMHEENYFVSKEVVEAIINAKNSNKQVLAVGTTTCRVLETIFEGDHPKVQDYHGSTSIFIYPGFQFRCITALVTNFHLPKSTLLLLVSAFAGKELIFAAYQEAIKERYRFFSFGDAMLIC
jgi:S-adenosylmethionine:tRNA ribosyltransferase-isomerase